MTSKRLFVAAAMVLSVGCVADADDGSGAPDYKRSEQQVIIDNLVDAGFPEDDIMVLEDGRVVVGRDAVVTMQASRELAGIVSDVEGADDFRQYRTTNTVNTDIVDTICIRANGFNASTSATRRAWCSATRETAWAATRRRPPPTARSR